jgi:hypothetical protein
MAEVTKADIEEFRRLEQLRIEMKNERNTFDAHWRDLSDYILPRRTRFFTQDANKGDKRNQKINDITATLAVRTLRSGMMGGLTSPSRPWFKLSTGDPDQEPFGPVANWLADVTKIMRDIFLKSNLYNILPIAYGDLGTFGTACVHMEEDLNGSVVRFESLPIGSFTVANNKDLVVDKMFREFRMTAKQIVEKFALDKETGKIDWSIPSQSVQDEYKNHRKETWYDIGHLIEPNDKFDPTKLHPKYKRYKSTYYELGTAGSNTNTFVSDMFTDSYYNILRESGFDFFPALCPRWEITGEDVYGTSCPGMIALADVKQLQVGERRGLQALEKLINPPMIAPSNMKNSRNSIIPGDITYSDERDGQKGFRPAHEIRGFDLNALEQKQQAVRQRISRAFFEDLFLMLSQSDRREITAREVDERHEEKLLALGPVLEQLNQDLLDPLIDNTFEIMVKQGLVPDPPEEISGKELRVEYVSIMAQSQKLVGVAGLERFAGMVASLEASDPSVAAKVNKEKYLEVYADSTGIPPEIIRTDEEVEAIKQQQAQAQQQQMLMENAQQLSQAALNANELGAGETPEQNPEEAQATQIRDTLGI